MSSSKHREVTRCQKEYEGLSGNSSDAVDIESRFSNLKDSFRDFCEYDDQIATFPNESSNIEVVEEIFYTAQAAFRCHINPANTNQHDISQHQQPHASLDETLNLLASQQLNLIGALHERPPSELRMPTLTIPQFNGSYATWPSFQDLYKSIVHTNSRLSKIQKFQYLKGLLIGDAADQIRHILVTEENYDTAWEKLVDRYDKKKQIINNYIKTFIEQPQLNFASATQLRRLADTSDEVIRGLGTVGPDAQKRDPWLIYILLQKTDDYTRQLWAIKASEKKLHSFDEFIQFINERCDALEAYTAHNPFFESNNSQQQQNAVYTQSTNRFGSSSQPDRCPKCSGAHPLFKCQLFKTLPVQERRKLVLRAKLCFNCLHDGHQTSSCSSTYRCHYCNDKHHSSLHQHEQIRTHYTDVPSITERSTPSYSLTEAQHHEEHQEPFPTQSYSASHITQSACPTLLPTALVYVQDEQGKSRPYRALLDSGSMVSFVSESCAQLLGIKRKHHRSSVCGLSSIEVAVTKGEVVLKLYTLNGIINLRALVLQKVTSPLPSVDISTKAWPWIHKHKLADPFFYKSQNIDILIGADYFFQVLENGQIKFAPNDPILQNTVFGWVVAGPHYQCENQSNDNPKSYQVTVVCDIDRTLTKFWEVETVSATNNYLTDEEKHCETHFKTHLCFNLDGRLVVRLPFTKSSEHLGNSKRTAVSCLLSMERRLANDPELYQQYRNFMNEYIAMGHMQKIPSSEVNIADNKGFYLPHHAVVKPSSTTTKVRVVFNASRKTSSGVSLNDILGVGPTIQRDLFSILINFRQYMVPVSADVTKMYRQIKMNSQDWNYQRIVWRDDPSKKIQDFWLTTVTYGTSSAPFLATRALYQIADDCSSTHPTISSIIKNHFYVDDLLTGADSPEEATNIRELLKSTLKKRGFELRKWKSSSKEFINKVPTDKRESECIDFDSEPTKLLGLYWNPDGDYFSFHASLSDKLLITKRTILSESAKIFDPLGLLSPATITLKILFQQLWVELPDGTKLNWDDIVPERLAEKWRVFTNEFKFFKNIKVDRWIHTRNVTNCEFHGFCDASELAYSAVVYCRTEHQGNIFVKIVAAKTKVAPLKQQSLPRLELCGALLLAKLFKSIRKAFNDDNLQRMTAWTDSQIVLSWLNSQPRRWTTFVANRTATILNICDANSWRYVSSQDNPADSASRGVSPKTLTFSEIWWQGPLWLKKSKSHWPSLQPSSPYQTKIEEKRINIQTFHTNVSNSSVCEVILAMSSSFGKIIRTVAYWLRLKSMLQFKVILKKTDIKTPLPTFSFLSTLELKAATIICLRWVQQAEFSEELRCLKTKKSVQSSSKLSSLFPFVDCDGLLRVGGRLHNSSCNYDAQHPIILPKQHSITPKLIDQYHKRHLHPGPTLLLSIMRQKYWIIGGRSTIRRYIHKCLNCFRLKRIKQQQLMGSLPEQRVHPSRPFLHCGVDYAGPIKIRLNKGRCVKTSKGYIALYVCFSTKAIHVEMVSDLTTDAFIASLKRFIARRGIPAGIYSDNGTNFIGAKRRLSDVYKMVLSNNFNSIVATFLSQNECQWHFIPPASPHFGGLWESGVKAVKTHLRRVIGDALLTFEEMATLLTQIEGILNSRPLSQISDSDVSSLDPLTPGHFLIGTTIAALPETNLIETNPHRLNRWQQIQRMVQSYWKQWSRDYLHTLNQRPKWRKESKNIAVDDLVLVHEDNLPPTAWLLGRIIAVHPGKDDLVRAVTLRTKMGELKRPIVKISKLPIN